jgi:hypothetical protein
MRDVISNVIINVVSEGREEREKNGPAKDKRRLCVIQLAFVGTSARAH